ncbi:MAG: hypothetical protein EOP06_06635 [Proteobacteria bacterium]|nr:MAG: hypothetical protein EOP06_06635 [Pseudomonadota bacterium]
MDDSSGVVANGGIGGVIPNIEEEHLWHSIPKNKTPEEVLKRKNELWNKLLKETDTKKRLKYLGVFFHYQQDTWAHRVHPSSQQTGFTTYKVPFGHALDGHQPDRVPFDPVCALRCLEDSIGYAKQFMTVCLKRTPNKIFDGYTPAQGEVEKGWADKRKGKYFNQLALDVSTPAHQFLTDIVRSQVNSYKSSLDKGAYIGRYTADEASYDTVRRELNAVCQRAQLPIIIPEERNKIESLTTKKIISGDI